MKRKGYTLVEMLVVLAIIMLLMAIVVPQFSFQRKGAGLKGSANQIMSSLRTARRLAIKDIKMYAVAFDIYSIPARFGILEKTGLPSDSDYWYQWKVVGEFERLTENVAIVAINRPTATSFNAARTDDLTLDGVEDIEFVLTTSGEYIYNPQIVPPAYATKPLQPGPNGLANQIFRLVRFQPTGTADAAIIYLWNTTENRQEMPSPTVGQMLSNFHALGVPPGLLIDDPNDQESFFRLPNEESTDDLYYYTLVVNSITGGVTVYDYAWGEGGGGGSPPKYKWDRKKDGEA